MFGFVSQEQEFEDLEECIKVDSVTASQSIVQKDSLQKIKDHESVEKWLQALIIASCCARHGDTYIHNHGLGCCRPAGRAVHKCLLANHYHLFKHNLLLSR